MLVDMERSYITAGFFRYTMARRFEASQSQAAVQKALNKVGGSRGVWWWLYVASVCVDSSKAPNTLALHVLSASRQGRQCLWRCKLHTSSCSTAEPPSAVGAGASHRGAA